MLLRFVMPWLRVTTDASSSCIEWHPTWRVLSLMCLLTRFVLYLFRSSLLASSPPTSTSLICPIFLHLIALINWLNFSVKEVSLLPILFNSLINRMLFHKGRSEYEARLQGQSCSTQESPIETETLQEVIQDNVNWQKQPNSFNYRKCGTFNWKPVK